MNFLVDNQLPDALCKFLTSRTHQCQHVLHLKMDESSDTEIWNYVLKTKEILVSKDEDFLHLANRPGDTGKFLWVRLGNCRKQELLAAFDKQLLRIIQAFNDGHRIVEIR